MRKVLIYHLLGLLSISLFLVPSFKWILSGKELPASTTNTNHESMTLKEILSFEFDDTMISLYYNPYSGIHFGNQNTPFVNSLKPYCSKDQSVCLYPDTQNQIVMSGSEILEPWMSVDYDEKHFTIHVYQLKTDEEVIFVQDKSLSQYSTSCFDKNFCRLDSTVTIDEINDYVKKKESVAFSTIKQFRTQFKRILTISENWIHYQPMTGNRYSNDLSVSYHQIEADKNILCISTGGSAYYLLKDYELKEFIQLLSQE